MFDATELWRAARRNPRTMAFGLWALAAGVAFYASIGKLSRAGQPSEHDHSRHARSAHACKPWRLPKKNYGIIENIPPGDWCIQVGAGQTLEVNAASGQVEVSTETPMRLDVHYRNEIVRTATIGKGRCADLDHQKYNLLTYTPVGAGGTIRVRDGRFPDSIVKC